MRHQAKHAKAGRRDLWYVLGSLVWVAIVAVIVARGVTA